MANYDNEMGVKSLVPMLAVIPEVLNATGIAGDMESVRLELLEPSGEPLALDISPVDSVGGINWVDARDGSDAPEPIYLKRMDEPWWFEYLEKERTVYTQINSIRDKKDEPIAGFYSRLFAFIDANTVERLVLDIRHNGGGNNYLNQTLVHHLIRCDKVNSPGRLFTLIGRKTFSAAMNLTNDLERHTRTLFVGEPTGSSPNHFGDGKAFTLPNSGIGFQVSTLRWQYSDPNDNRPWVAPDLSAELSSGDYRDGCDPALDAILSIAPGSLSVAPFPERLIQAINAFSGTG